MMGSANASDQDGKAFGDVMILDVQGNVIRPLTCSAKRSNSGCAGKGSDGVYCIRVSGLPKRTDHDTAPEFAIGSLAFAKVQFFQTTHCLASTVLSPVPRVRFPSFGFGTCSAFHIHSRVRFPSFGFGTRLAFLRPLASYI
jgi:hypothetical protein